MGKYVDLSEMYDTLSAQAINAGQSFLAGKVTSTFSSIKNDEDVQALTNAATTGIGLYSTISEGVKNIDIVTTSLVSELANHAMEAITKETVKIITDFVDKHVDAVTGIPKGIVDVSLSHFNEKKVSLGDVLKVFVTDQEKIDALNIKNAEIERKTKFITNIKDKYMKNKSKISSAINVGLSYINLVTSYIEQGPQWVESKMDEGVEFCVSYIQKGADKQWEIDKKAIDDFIKAEGENVGQRMADEFNTILMREAKKIVTNKEKEIQKLITKANTLLQKAKLTIMSLTGINLPF